MAEGFGKASGCAVNMFEIVAVIFLDIETVFDFSALASSFVNKFNHVISIGPEIGKIREPHRFFIVSGYVDIHRMEKFPSVFQVVDPAVLAGFLRLRIPYYDAVFRVRRKFRFGFGVEGRNAVGKEGDEKAPVIFREQIDDFFTCVKSIAESADRESRETVFDVCGETVKRLEFAVLLDVVLSVVFDELEAETQRQSGFGDQFSVNHLMKIISPSVAVLCRQTVCAMRNICLPQHFRAVKSDRLGKFAE